MVGNSVRNTKKEVYMTNHILNIDDIDYQVWQHGDRFEAKLGALSSRIGAQKLV